MIEKSSSTVDESKKIICRKCGKENPVDAKFCLNCGSRLYRVDGGNLRDLRSLFLVGSLYLLLSAITLSDIFLLFILYLIPGLTGLYVTFLLNRGVKGSPVKLLSILSLGMGFLVTLWIYYNGLVTAGLTAGGLIGPSWIIFLVTGWRLWKRRSEI